MTAQQPERTYHCGTCSHAEKSNAKEYPFKCGISKPVPMYVHEYCVSWFQYVGCASHSTRPHIQTPERIGAAIKDLESTLLHSKMNLMGFTNNEAEWISGYESGLERAIDIIRGE